MQFFKNIFSSGQTVNLEEVIARGAIILDVRTPHEFKNGHLKNSKNIPLDQLPDSIADLDRSKPVITCCATGIRSITAKNILKSIGFTEVYNGGSWTSLKKFEK
jgi:phage shock protein E